MRTAKPPPPPAYRERLVSQVFDTEASPAQTRRTRAAKGHAFALLRPDAASDALFARRVAETPTEPAYLAERRMIAARRGRRAKLPRHKG